MQVPQNLANLASPKPRYPVIWRQKAVQIQAQHPNLPIKHSKLSENLSRTHKTLIKSGAKNTIEISVHKFLNVKYTEHNRSSTSTPHISKSTEAIRTEQVAE